MTAVAMLSEFSAQLVCDDDRPSASTILPSSGSSATPCTSVTQPTTNRNTSMYVAVSVALLRRAAGDASVELLIRLSLYLGGPSLAHTGTGLSVRSMHCESD